MLTHQKRAQPDFEQNIDNKRAVAEVRNVVWSRQTVRTVQVTYAGRQRTVMCTGRLQVSLSGLASSFLAAGRPVPRWAKSSRRCGCFRLRCSLFRDSWLFRSAVTLRSDGTKALWGSQVPLGRRFDSVLPPEERFSPEVIIQHLAGRGIEVPVLFSWCSWVTAPEALDLSAIGMLVTPF